MYKSLFVIGLLILSSHSLKAAEFEIEIAPVWWQYEEISEKRAGFGLTPLDSLANGWAAGIDIAFQVDVSEKWQLRSTWQGMLPINKGKETWNLRARTQSNDLTIKESEIRQDILYLFNDFSTGIWTSYQWHEQARQQFFVNGIPVALSNEPIKETVQTAWLGGVLQATSADGLWQTRMDAGVPIWVKTTNDLVTGTFRTRKGFQAGVDISHKLPSLWDGADHRMAMAYQYRELGGEVLNNTWLWPKNRWQTLSLALQGVW